MTDATMTKALPRREDVPVLHTWNAESVYATPEAVEGDFKYILSQVEEAPKYQGHLADGASVLADWFQIQEDIFNHAQKLYFYGYMSKASNIENSEAAALADRAAGLFGRALAAMAFSEPELLAIGRETLEQWTQQEPRLAHYAHYIDDLFRRQEHVRSAE